LLNLAAVGVESYFTSLFQNLFLSAFAHCFPTPTATLKLVSKGRDGDPGGFLRAAALRPTTLGGAVCNNGL